MIFLFLLGDDNSYWAGPQVADRGTASVKVSCEYGNKQPRTKSRVALWQGLALGSHPNQGYGEIMGSSMVDVILQQRN